VKDETKGTKEDRTSMKLIMPRGEKSARAMATPQLNREAEEAVILVTIPPHVLLCGDRIAQCQWRPDHVQVLNALAGPKHVKIAVV
jgi:hypothetical protein